MHADPKGSVAKWIVNLFQNEVAAQHDHQPARAG